MNNKITYVFLSGRKNRLEKSFKDAQEFFYSYLYFKDKYDNTEIIEFSHNKGVLNTFLKFIDKVLRKFTKLPFFMSDILIIKNIKILLNSRAVMLTSDRIACSILPLLIINSLRYKKTSFSCIVLGLFQHKNVKGIRKFVQKALIKSVLMTCSNFIFLGKGEFDFASSEYQDYAAKFHFVPFCVDVNFWNIENKSSSEMKKDILFVGNDGNRLYKLVLQLAEIFKDINFKLITSNIEKEEIKVENIELVRGHWQSNEIPDSLLKKYYQESRITIIPIKNTLQPSGQSVALQSMANGTPVMISKTDGFWSYDDFKDNENIFFVNNNDLKGWEQKINKLYFDFNLLDSVSNNALRTVQEKFNLGIFHNNIENIMNNND